MRDVCDEIRAHGLKALDLRNVVKDKDVTEGVFVAVPETHRIDPNPSSFIKRNLLGKAFSGAVTGQNLLHELLHFRVP